ncbi:hypothetical protein [Salinicoccus luteus]|uniref:hypothetical protein n=1 Tax=Salinicoccus luteus TaxID=367840 RepID=UPI0004E0CD63|nr:hypothetical protein [Salinicoccus luteus]
MNKELLKSVLKNHLEHQKVNTYFRSFDGTRQIAEYYAATLPNMTTKVDGKKIDFFYRKNHIGYIDGQNVSTNSKQARQLCNNKFKSEDFLNQKNVATTVSKLFDETEYEAALEYIKISKGPKVVKPTMLNGAKGITLNVDEESFDYAWNNCVNACKDHKREPKILIQDQLNGIEVRVLVIEGNFNSAILRAPAHIVGDGHHSISELIEEKNKLKKKNPHQRLRLIKVDDTAIRNIKSAGFELEDIPEEGQYVFIHHTSNISIGGDPYEVSDLLGVEIKNLAEKAVEAIPDLNTAGVDIMIDSLDDKYPNVLEINAAANLRLHHFPYKGPAHVPVYNFVYALTLPYL